jgi:hypothetical protein
MKTSKTWLCALILISPASVVFAQTFTRITAGVIVNEVGSSYGCAWGDYDNDGDLDLFVAVGFGGNFLYQNNGDGSFTKVTSGPIIDDRGSSYAGSWGDYDNDGDLDLFVANDGNNFLYRNDLSQGAGFTKMTSGPIVNDGGRSPGASWGDYDNDGHLDLFVANEFGNNFLYHNNGDGSFTKVTSGPIVTDSARSYAGIWGDYDNDGDLDLFVANDGNNFLYRNNGKGDFTKIMTGAMVTDGGNSRSASWGDYDNDGDLDLFVANSGDFPLNNDFLYENNGDGTFAKITAGPIVNDGARSNGSSWADYDNDGDLDLFVANEGPNFLYRNDGNRTFTKITTGAIVTDSGLSGGAGWGDYNNDGHLDLFVTNSGIRNLLYQNDGNNNRWINLSLAGVISNASAIGARVSVKATINGAPIWQTRELSGQTGAYGQNSLNAEFGLGNAATIDSIKVAWPSGIVQHLTNVASKQFLTITEPQFARVTSVVANDGGNSFGSAWGDYDNDGDLDLFVANIGDDFLYRNNGNLAGQAGSFSKVPTGVVVQSGGRSFGASWGDYDNDGDLDLFVANSGEKSFLYQNNGNGEFTRITAGPTVNDVGSSNAASWGDYDGDGHLDLFVANLGANFLYRNNGDKTFSKIITGAIVTDGGRSLGGNWVDYDNDGDLDLFVANANGENNFLYRNNGKGEFARTTGPVVSDGGNSFGGSWGDYDNDGDLDLFVANDGNNFLYRNNGEGSFTKITTGAIVQDGGQSFGSSWGDYDNDGDLDLFVANIGDDFLYRNDFDPVRPGQVVFSKVTTDVIVRSGGRSYGSSWGDYDNDGDLDLFVANILNENNFLYQTYTGSNHWIKMRLIGTVSNASAIGAKVRVKARIKGAPVWQMREISGQTGYLGQNSLNVEFGLREAARLDSIRIEWPSGAVNTVANVETNRFLIIRENNRPRVAAGISDIVLPKDAPVFVRDLRADPAVFVDADKDTLNYTAASSNPRVASASVSGSVLTVSLASDTASGKAAITVTANDGRGESAAMTFAINRPPFIRNAIPDLTLPLGALKRVNLQEVFVDPEGDAITYTFSNSNDSVMFVLISEATLFLFPEKTGRAVVTLRADDGKAGISAMALNIDIVISPRPEIQHNNIATANRNEEIAVAANISDDEGSLSFAFLNYRKAGEPNFVTARMDTLRIAASTLRAAASIPASAATERGVEYFIEAADNHNVRSRQPEAGVFSIRIRVEGEGVRNDTPQPFGTEQTGYHLISAPLELDAKSPASVLEDDLGPYDPTQWRLYAWQPLESGGVTKIEFPNTSAMSPGAAFWLIIKSAGKFIDTGPGTTISTSVGFEIPLNRGWNLVGNPFNFPTVAEDTLRDGEPLHIFSYSGVWSSQLNPSTTQLQPFEGYAVFSPSASAMLVKPNPFDAGTSLPKQVARNDIPVKVENVTQVIARRFLPKQSAGFQEIASLKSARNDGYKLTQNEYIETLWSIRILAQCQMAKDENNVAAVVQGASREWDFFDHPEPPGIGEYVSVYFPHPEWRKLSKNYCTDFRPEPAEGEEWEIEIETNIRDVVNLTFAGVESVPADYEVWLVDKALKITGNLRQRNNYSVAGRGENYPKRLTLVVGKKRYFDEKFAELQLVPTNYELSQNFPNPFNPATTIQYCLPNPDRVILRVYDILGKEVVTLVDHELKEAGYHAAIWDGRNAAGNVVASGVYFVRMQTANFVRIRKMVLVE